MPVPKNSLKKNLWFLRIPDYSTDSSSNTLIISISTLITSFILPVFTASSASTHLATAFFKIDVLNFAAWAKYLYTAKEGTPIVLLLQYGHGTRNGGWVEGRDYINPAIQPVFDRIVDDAWKEVTKL